MTDQRRKPSLLQFAIIFLLVYLITQGFFRIFFPEQFAPEGSQTGIVLDMLDATVKGGHHPTLVVRNRTEQSFTLPDRCPQAPVDVYRIAEGQEPTLLEATDIAVSCVPVGAIEPGKQAQVDLAPWKYSLFGEYGKYELRLPDTDSTTQFTHYEAGAVTRIFRTFITKPLLNLLIWVASLLPGHSLGWSVIIVTIMVKILLFFPTQHALEGQSKLQAIQPKMDELRRKYKEDPQRLNQETLKLWKENKINPFQSCMPMLLQFPVLIGLFFVIRDGGQLELSRHLIYSTYQDLPWTFGTQFLGLDLLLPSIFIMPPLLFVMQFIQLKMTFAIAKKKQPDKKKVIDVTPKEKGKEDKKGKPDIDMERVQNIQQKGMLWGLPIMIAAFATTFPAAVSLYWGVSTVFGIGQQLVVNRKHLSA